MVEEKACPHDLSKLSCWVVAEDLVGLQHQAIGLAQALGLSYVVKKIKKSKGLWSLFFNQPDELEAPWPDILITCGKRSVSASLAVRKKSGGKTFTVHIQHPQVNPKEFDVVIAPEHDRVHGSNVLLTNGAVHHVTLEKLKKAADHFHPLFSHLSRPFIGVLVGGKSRHQDFSAQSAHDLACKLLEASENSGGGLAITPSRRTGQENENILKEQLKSVPSFYIWDGQEENPYFGLLALADIIVVTSDSVSMLSEACFTGKPVYVYEIPGGSRRHKQFQDNLLERGMIRPFLGKIETWKNQPLDETRRAAQFVRECFMARGPLEEKLTVTR